MKPNQFFTTVSALFIALNAHTQAAVSLGTAANFRVLAGSTITNTGATVVNGSIGVDPGTAITGFFGTVENDGPGIFTGTAHQADTVANEAKADALTAFNNLNGLAITLTLGDDLTGESLFPGVYELGSAALNGILTLDGPGDFVFQINSALNTTGPAVVNFINGAEASNVFWAVGSSATFGSGTVFAGNVIALTSISFDNGASLDGRAIALNGAVTLINNSIIPEPSTMSLLAFLSIGLIARRRRASN